MMCMDKCHAGIQGAALHAGLQSIQYALKILYVYLQTLLAFPNCSQGERHVESLKEDQPG